MNANEFISGMTLPISFAKHPVSKRIDSSIPTFRSTRTVMQSGEESHYREDLHNMAEAGFHLRVVAVYYSLAFERACRALGKSLPRLYRECVGGDDLQEVKHWIERHPESLSPKRDYRDDTASLKFRDRYEEKRDAICSLRRSLIRIKEGTPSARFEGPMIEQYDPRGSVFSRMVAASDLPMVCIGTYCTSMDYWRLCQKAEIPTPADQ